MTLKEEALKLATKARQDDADPAWLRRLMAHDLLQNAERAGASEHTTERLMLAIGAVATAEEHPKTARYWLNRAADTLEAIADRLDAETRPHEADEDCTIDPATGLCFVCGVEHGDPCPECGATAYHRPDCPETWPMPLDDPDLSGEREGDPS